MKGKFVRKITNTFGKGACDLPAILLRYVTVDADSAKGVDVKEWQKV